MNAIFERLRKRIREYLEVSEMTQKKFAETIGCSPALLSMFLNKSRNIDLQFVIKACDVMGIGLREIDNDAVLEPMELVLAKKKMVSLYNKNPQAFGVITDNLDAWLTIPGSEKSEKAASQ